MDGAAVDASIERNVLSSLRRSGARVPSGLLTRQQAWGLAHASEFVPSTDDEMVDPWDVGSSSARRMSKCDEIDEEEELRRFEAGWQPSWTG